MPENCEKCQVAARVDALEKEFDRYRDNSSKTHQQMFDRLGSLERSQTSLHLEGWRGRETGHHCGVGGGGEEQAEQAAGQAERKRCLVGSCGAARRCPGEVRPVMKSVIRRLDKHLNKSARHLEL